MNQSDFDNDNDKSASRSRLVHTASLVVQLVVVRRRDSVKGDLLLRYQPVASSLQWISPDHRFGYPFHRYVR